MILRIAKFFTQLPKSIYLSSYSFSGIVGFEKDLDSLFDHDKMILLIKITTIKIWWS